VPRGSRRPTQCDAFTTCTRMQRQTTLPAHTQHTGRRGVVDAVRAHRRRRRIVVDSTPHTHAQTMTTCMRTHGRRCVVDTVHTHIQADDTRHRRLDPAHALAPSHARTTDDAASMQTGRTMPRAMPHAHSGRMGHPRPRKPSISGPSHSCTGRQPHTRIHTDDTTRMVRHVHTRAECQRQVV
jgi:hypothetical protein